MTYRFLSLTSIALVTASPLTAVVINWSGTSYNSDTSSSYGWVLGSHMFESLDSGNATATSQAGFIYFDTHDITQLTWTFGDLELTNHLSPGATTAGFEYYSEADNNVTDFEMFQNDTLVASGDVLYLQTDVANSSDATGTGAAGITLTTAGADPTFFNEIMALSGGTGALSIEIGNFDPMSDGVFNSNGTLTVVPEPSATALFVGLFALACIPRRRR
jgi:hypothetical protein